MKSSHISLNMGIVVNHYQRRINQDISATEGALIKRRVQLFSTQSGLIKITRFGTFCHTSSCYTVRKTQGNSRNKS